MTDRFQLESLTASSLPESLTRKPVSLQGGPLDSESRFYETYPWCLNVFPRTGEILEHLRLELVRAEELEEVWQRAEAITNVFLLSCAVADSIDDYMLGRRFDFSFAHRVPGTGPILRMAEGLLRTVQRVRERRLRSVHNWRQAWGAGVQDFLGVVVANETDGDALRHTKSRLMSMLAAGLPPAVLRRRPKLPAAFRSQDMTHFDILELGRRFIADFPNRAQPVLVVGLRTAGSYFAPLLCALFAAEGYRAVEAMTMRPKVGLSSQESEALARNAKKGGLAVLVDEPPDTGTTLAGAADLLKKAGFAVGNAVALLPIHSTRREWASGEEFLSLSRSGIHMILLEPENYHKQQLLAPRTVEARLDEYFRRRNYASANVRASLAADRLNVILQKKSEEKFHTRLKRIFEVCAFDAQGRTETRYILAKSVGWGWLGYHAFVMGTRLAAFVPPILGLRDGILYTEWLPQFGRQGARANRGRWLDVVACYVAERVHHLGLARDPVPDLARANQHNGTDLLAATLASAYGGRAVAFLRRARLRHELARRTCPMPTVVDAKMRPQEWISGPLSVLKTDFEHHGLGKNEVNVTDPAYDLAETILHFRLSEVEEHRLVQCYIEKSGDTGVEERLFLNKLLAGTVAMKTAWANLDDGRLAGRAEEWNRLLIEARDFLTVHTARLCGRMCGRPATLRWRSPLVVMDIDGVLDKGIFGFPSTSAAGLRALSLLHAHDVAVAINTARTLSQVQEYCRAYGFAGGVAEYGAAAWDAVGGQERILVSSGSLEQLEKVRSRLRRIPGVFQNSDYQYSIRAYACERSRTVPLPTFLVRDLLAELRADQLRFHQTYLDTAIVAQRVDKGTGLLALLELIGQPDVETIAIGDSEADLPMFRVAHRSFAPSQISCRPVARLLGCRIADHAYQAGLLSSVRSILHPDGRRCIRCQSGSQVWLGEGDPLFAELLEAADQRQLRAVLQALRDPMSLHAFVR